MRRRTFPVRSTSHPIQWTGEPSGRIPDRGTEVIVYCSDVACDSSVIVAKRLIELGYRNVSHYAEGKNDWVAAGLPLEGGRISQRSELVAARERGAPGHEPPRNGSPRTR